MAISCKQGVHRSQAAAALAKIMAPDAKVRHLTCEAGERRACGKKGKGGRKGVCGLCSAAPRAELRAAIVFLMSAA